MPGVLPKPDGFEPLGDLLRRGAAMRGSFRRIVPLRLQRLAGPRLGLFPTWCSGSLLHCLHPRIEDNLIGSEQHGPWAQLRFERQEPSCRLPSGSHPNSSHTRIAFEFSLFHLRLAAINGLRRETRIARLIKKVVFLNQWPRRRTNRAAHSLMPPLRLIKNAQRWTSTGILQWVRTLTVSLPRTIAEMPWRPCEAMTIRSQPFDSAVSMIAR
jgi:hypothetical protein